MDTINLSPLTDVACIIRDATDFISLSSASRPQRALQLTFLPTWLTNFVVACGLAHFMAAYSGLRWRLWSLYARLFVCLYTWHSVTDNLLSLLSVRARYYAFGVLTLSVGWEKGHAHTIWLRQYRFIWGWLPHLPSWWYGNVTHPVEMLKKTSFALLLLLF